MDENWPSSEIAQFDYSQCLHSKLWRVGYRQCNRKQRLRCIHCKQYFTVEGRDDRLTRIRKIAVHFIAGSSMYQAVKETGYSKETVRKYYELLKAYSSNKIK